MIKTQSSKSELLNDDTALKSSCNEDKKSELNLSIYSKNDSTTKFKHNTLNNPAINKDFTCEKSKRPYDILLNENSESIHNPNDGNKNIKGSICTCDNEKVLSKSWPNQLGNINIFYNVQHCCNKDNVIPYRSPTEFRKSKSVLSNKLKIQNKAMLNICQYYINIISIYRKHR